MGYVFIVIICLGYKRGGSTLFLNSAIKKSFTGEVAIEVSLEERVRVYQEEEIEEKMTECVMPAMTKGKGQSGFCVNDVNVSWGNNRTEARTSLSRNFT